MKIKERILDILFPKLCLICKKEGQYLCEDCKALIDISENIFCLCNKPKRMQGKSKCGECEKKYLDGIFSVASKNNRFANKVTASFQNEPYIKELSIPLSELIVSHFKLIEKDSFPKDKILISVPKSMREIKRIGYDPAKEIAKRFNNHKDCLMKEGNDYLIKNKEEIINKRIILIDIYFSNKLEIIARVLKRYKAKEVWGLVLAR